MLSNRITQSVIVGTATFIGAITWSGLKNLLFSQGGWLWPSLGFLILLIFLSLTWLLTKSKPVLLTTLIFILLSFFLPFGIRLEYIAVGFIAFLLLTAGSFRALDEKEARLKIQSDKIMRRGLPIVITGLCLLIATTYFFSPLNLVGNEIKVPRALFNIMIEPVENILEKQLSLIELTSQFNLSLDANDDFKDALYLALNQEINKQGQAYKEYLSIGLAVGVFFGLKMVGVPFMWLVIFSTWAIFRTLILSGAIKIQEKAVLKEVIET